MEHLMGGIDPEMCSPERLLRTHSLAELPRAMGGLGHMPVCRLAPLAFLGGFKAAMPLRQFAEKCAILSDDLTLAYGYAINAMGGVDRVCEERAHNDALGEVFPANPAALWDSSQQHAQAPPADNESKKLSVGM
jgi:hypothetical protein